MKRLIILGAGGFGREVLCWATQTTSHDRDWVIGGFLDDNEEIVGSKIHEVQVISTIKDYRVTADDVFICAMGDPSTKKKVCEDILGKGGTFINIIHPSVVTGINIKIGIGVILCPNVTLTCDLTIGDFVTVNISSTVGHDAYLGNWTTLSPNCNIAGAAILEEGVFLGSNATILPKAKIGSYATVGAGSVVLRKVSPNITVFGVPATEIL